MSSSNRGPDFRGWMDKPRMDPASGLLTEEYAEGLKQFMEFAANQEMTLQSGKMFCPCTNCRNHRLVTAKSVWKHLYSRGFMPGYKIWYSHGENDYMVDYGSSSRDNVIVHEHPIVENVVDSTVRMVNDAFPENNEAEEPNLEARRFFDMLDASKQPLYAGCRDGHSPLSAATRMMTIKTDYNLSEDCVDAFADFMKGYLPEDNLAPSSYYEIQKLVSGLGLPFQVIDVCIDNCMIYWRRDSDLLSCRFCHKPRYKDTSGRVAIPHKRMWYLPLTERLQRLYQSEETANGMKWHGEHTFNGEISHPSDAEAWKHFQSVYPSFAVEHRNVYLGLSTDGFSPFGKHGRQYSLWPVIVTPYNLPPSLCMRRQFLFLTILVPGPDHPKRALDIFLQPLIHELRMLWETGVPTFDVSCRQNFTMRAALMWTISDFPAYGMLSGWSTHGRLACPYCQDDTDAFQLHHGRKTCWFDCHRRFLPSDHPYRRSTTLFRKNKKIFDSPPTEVDGESLLLQFRDFGVEKTATCGGNQHDRVDGFGEYHNWHKKSIFWDLPYWKDLLLRHNLDVMHVEKNVFDNIMNTVLNVQGKTKDNLKSRMDLPHICARPHLHLAANGKPPNVLPSYRLGVPEKQAFFDWIIEGVIFPDGYASNLRNCVDSRDGRFSGMKSHDCHVVMQRLLPFAFAFLLPRKVHEAIAAVGAFFRDICSRSLTIEGIHNLEEKIPMILCNLEKLFPPSFFDVMEHLPVHLPREARLGGPVQYRWMYPFERYMYHLKKKVKNLSRVEGSIVAQNINEETSNFAGYYFAPQTQTKSRRSSRNDDGGVRPFYPVEVPTIFTQIGRLSGKGKNRRLTEQERDHLQMYILSNCEEVHEYESIYMSQVRDAYPQYTDIEIEELKQNEFRNWLKFYVTWSKTQGHFIPTWLEELVNGPLYMAISHPMYFTRGYAFKIFRGGKNRRSTANDGVSTQSGDSVFYGTIKEILEISFPGMLGLKCVAFYCNWFNPILGTGVKQDQFGVTSVNTRKKLQKYDPFVLASQADQVCYLPYPRVTQKNDPWMTATRINPRRTVEGVSENDPLQESSIGVLGDIDHTMDVDVVMEYTDEADNELFEESEEDIEEFEQHDAGSSSDYSSDSD